MEEDSQQQIRYNLQQRLLSAVKQCQKHFATTDDMGTEGDMRVSSLCTEWEAVLTHGAKKSKNILRGFAKGDFTGGVSIWSIMCPLLSEEEVQRFNKLEHVNNDIGRGRAWLRAALNERTLEDYLHSLLSNKPHLLNCYEGHAFLLDGELTAMLPTMAAGLGTIIFSLNIDTDSLNTHLKTVDAPVNHAPLPLEPTSTPKVVVPLPIPPPSSHAHFGTRIGDHTLQEEDNVVAVRKEKKKKRKTKATPTGPAHNDGGNIPGNNLTNHASPDTLTHKDHTHTGYHDNLNPFNDGTSLCSTPSVNSLNSMCEEGVVLFNAPSIPSNKPPSKDTVVMESQAAIESTSMVLAATGEHQQHPSCEGEGTVVMTTSGTMSMTVGEMKEALAVLVRGKELVEEKNVQLEAELKEERSVVMTMSEEVEQLKKEVSALKDSHAHQTQSLERENDLLKGQLKRYVGLVKQQQETGEEAGPMGGAGPEKDLATKLSEMAEMYGELMEFNDRLHKDVYCKDNIIIKLCHSLLAAGQEIPVPADQLPQDALKPKRIVEVRIPSVIRRDKGYHVYQVYLLLGNEEWNVYRRFAEFYEFHQQMLKSIEGVDEFPFPSKKAIGSKAAQVVEERRVRLQEYLRFVVELCSQSSVKRKDGRVTRGILDCTTSKEDLLRIFPFFRPDPAQTTPTSSAAMPHPPMVKSPSYSGL